MSPWPPLWTAPYAVVTVVHVACSIRYCIKHKRSFFEGLALATFLIVAWPLFSVGMMSRGYLDFIRELEKP